MIPPGYLDKIASSTVTGAARKSARSFWRVATQESTGFDSEASVALTKLTEPTRMALAQLGSCEWQHPPAETFFLFWSCLLIKRYCSLQVTF
jgi:hypothetical protein